jgi:hypothetical protein
LNTYRKTAITVGILFIICTVASILGPSLVSSMMNTSDYFNKLADNSNQTIIAALLEFIWAAAGAGIAIVLYPLLRKYNGAMALGAVGFRVVEGIFVLIGTLSMLSLLSLSQEFVNSGAVSATTYQASGTALAALRDWAHGSFGLISFSFGTLLYSALLYRSKLIPRWLSGWGFGAAILCLGVTVYSTFNSDFGLTTVNTVLNAPIGLQEMVLAGWLIVKGFNPSAIASVSVKTELSEKALAYSK